MKSRAVLVCSLALVLAAAPAPAIKPFEGPTADQFLATAEVVAMKPLPFGVTKPFKVTLRDGERTAHAVWKTIDVFNPHPRNPRLYSTDWAETYFRDSYHHEIAAYELDKLLGLGLVPPTVERQIDGKRGSLQLWIEDAITEAKRLRSSVSLLTRGAGASRPTRCGSSTSSPATPTPPTSATSWSIPTSVST